MPASPGAYQMPPTIGGWPILNETHLQMAIYAMERQCPEDNLPGTTAVRRHIIQRASHLECESLVPTSWTPFGYIQDTSINLKWLREEAWNLGRAGLLPEVVALNRTYVDWDGKTVTAVVLGEPPVRAEAAA